MALLPDTPEYKKAHRQFLKATKNRPTNIDQDWTVFRAAEKRFKSRFPPPDLSDVLDLASRCGNDFPEHERGHWVGSPTVVDYVNVSLGDQNPAAFSVPRVPGLIILPGFLSPQKQKDLIYWSLTQHARQPNETNLDAHYVVPEAGLWNAYLKARKDPKQNIRVQPKASTSKEISQFHTGPRELINNTPASPESFEVIYKTPKLPASPSPTIQPSPITSLIFKLRWANIGWYYHWGTKQYDFTRGPGKISDDLVSLCKQAVRSVDWGKVHFSRGPEWGKNGPDWHTWNETYEPDAGIVNFYQEKDTLMAHVDRSEVCATSPLVSISLGNAAIFLIGGVTRETEPLPILLQSGDVVIMSGPTCRRAYHGVPRILEGTLPRHLTESEDHENQIEWEPYKEYMRTTRININMRQVFPKGFDPYASLK